MEKLYGYLPSIYRILVVSVFIYFHVKLISAYTSEHVIMYALFALYAILFALLKSNKWTSYLELMAIAGLIYFYKEPTLYYLLILPIMNFTSSNAKKHDILLFSILISGFVYIQFDHIWFTAFTFIGILATLSVFNIKFSQIEYLETKLYKERVIFQEVKKKLSDRDLELDNVLKMFMKSKELNEITQENKLIEVLVESSKEFFDAHYACLYLFEDGYIERHMEVGRKDKYDVLKSLGKEDVETDIIQGEMLQVVIYYENRPWGVIRIYGKTTKLGEKAQRVFTPFSEMDHELLLTYVDQVMIKMKEVRLSEKNEFLANFDFLTGVPNRRYFIDRFEQFSAMAARGEEFSILLLDIDHFKKFNDSYGHDTGDSVLKIVADTLAEAIRDKYDIVGRIGGEEFGILLLNPNDQSFLVADRIRKLISLVPAVEQITVSVGIAYYGIDGTDWEELFNSADKALYYAKENGRNQVIEHKNIK